MKIRFFAFASLFVFLSSCVQTYTCGRQCYLFNNGTVKICQTSAAESTQFYKSTDSLTHLYGSGMSIFADSVYVDGSSSSAINSVTDQLQQQGYTCNPNTY